MNLKEFDKYIQSVSAEEIDKHTDMLALYGNNLQGVRPKEFVKIPSKYFTQLIEHIQTNPDGSFYTYLNDDIKNGVIPECISVLKKELREGKITKERYGLGPIIDVIGSRLMVQMGCKAAYETIINVDGVYSSCSVNFRKQNEDLYTMSDLGDQIEAFDMLSLEKQLRKLRQDMDIFRESRMKDPIADEKFENMKASVQENFVYDFLVRRIAFRDIDFSLANGAVIYDPQNNVLKSATNFDFEMFFTDLKKGFSKNDKANLEFASKHYPRAFNKFMERVGMLIKKENGKMVVENIIEDTIGLQNKPAKQISKDLTRRIKKLASLTKKYAKNIDKDAILETDTNFDYEDFEQPEINDVSLNKYKALLEMYDVQFVQDENYPNGHFVVIDRQNNMIANNIPLENRSQITKDVLFAKSWIYSCGNNLSMTGKQNEFGFDEKQWEYAFNDGANQVFKSLVDLLAHNTGEKLTVETIVEKVSNNTNYKYSQSILSALFRERENPYVLQNIKETIMKEAGININLSADNVNEAGDRSMN